MSSLSITLEDVQIIVNSFKGGYYLVPSQGGLYGESY